MVDHSVTPSAVVRGKALALGEAGTSWLERLPAVVAEVERRWSVTAGEPLSGGTTAYVARVTGAGGRQAVVKIGLPGPGFAREMRTVVAARGVGYVQVLEADVERNAMLLEALGPSVDRLGLSPEDQIAVLCAMLRRAWELPRDALPDEEPCDKAADLGDGIAQFWTDLGRPCSATVIDRALTFARQLSDGFDPDSSRILHGDTAPANALQVLMPRPGAEGGFVFVDPDGFCGDPAYDVGVLLRGWSAELLAGDAPALAGRYCRLLAVDSGVDVEAVWAWGFLERVSTGLYLLSLGAEDLARPLLITAELLV